jgi:hypothetical protein
MQEVGGGLGRLIETETRLARELAAAQAEADQLVLEARAAAEDAEAGERHAVARDALAVEERIAAERQARLRRITAEGEERARRLRELPATTIEALALEMAARVLAAPPEAPR